MLLIFNKVTVYLILFKITDQLMFKLKTALINKMNCKMIFSIMSPFNLGRV